MKTKTISIFQYNTQKFDKSRLTVIKIHVSDILSMNETCFN